MLIILALARLRQEDQKFKTSLGYIESFKVCLGYISFVFECGHSLWGI